MRVSNSRPVWSYDELGYPTLVNIDVSFNTADEESYITVSDLLPTG